MFSGGSAFGFSGRICALPSDMAALLQMRRSSLKIKFTPEEDARLVQLVNQYGTKDWTNIALHMQTRNARQCRERWSNYVNPSLRTDPWTPEEDALLEEKCKEYGGKWNKIAKFFRNRSDNSIRNRWMMIARKKGRTEVPISPPSVTPPTTSVTPNVVTSMANQSQIVAEFPPVEMGLCEDSADMFGFGVPMEVFGNGDDWMTF